MRTYFLPLLFKYEPGLDCILRKVPKRGHALLFFFILVFFGDSRHNKGCFLGYHDL